MGRRFCIVEIWKATLPLISSARTDLFLEVRKAQTYGNRISGG